ncbi:diguanylate cyclase (GGDEF)-like protein/PAS domain S-box-containing protein [Kibdelosporangium banguiense]|uniref:Diguanylate cyclase (GGDEF)-like protein/PAS domain S-box-containing protein n=1 Tax=Kibdelosporangium banguiense TaxID=1365924 RepID=A0ABS4T744_9PSEU|nr:EAL domain-containing protein [Kibdelosporangium banguiense]MBP2320251.1 diguanylate cyclase (GGDEF)-like protein/PAS domain S-box-containing protein [Kibdelosporangium banguiense]
MPQRESISPLPDDAVAGHPGLIRERRKLARKWAYLICGTTYVPLSQADLESRLQELFEHIVTALRGDPVDTSVTELVATRLVAMNCTDSTSLRCTLEVLGKALLASPELRSVDRLGDKVITLLSALSACYTESIRTAVFNQQEEIEHALIMAVRDARWSLKVSEARFDEVVTCSSSGIVITDLNGRFVRANQSFGNIVGYTRGELANLSLFELVHPDETTYLREAYESVLKGEHDRLRHGRRLVRRDGEVARVSLIATVLRDGDDRPSHFLTVVEDGTELKLLQNELSRQALHDVLTGLPNRQFFTTHLEGVLRRADPATGVTLYHLDLDAFSLITGGLGRKTGDLLLIAVAERLKAVLANEKAMVARFDGDEFAILVENSPSTPDVLSMVTMINEELSEPVYIEDHGVAATASIGVVDRPPRTMDPAELLRASDMTLRRAKANGRRQWELFHPEQHAHDRRTFGMAAQMPGAWESGELAVTYRPIIRLIDKEVVGTEALLRWDHPEHGLLCGQTCLELAEETGLILALGPWLLRSACEKLRWDSDLPLSVNLTAAQSSDADLVGDVARVLRETGVAPERLSLGMPVRALLAGRGEAMDNLKLLAENGIQTVAIEFGGTPGDMVCVEDLPLKAIRVARWLVDREPVPGSPVTHAMLDMASLVHLAGAQVIVDGVNSKEQADWWRAAGADLAQGSLFS